MKGIDPLWPRSVMADNGQFLVYTPEEMAEVVLEKNGKCSIFVSNVAYPKAQGRVVNAEEITISTLYFDFDSYPKIENALIDVRKLKNWCNKEYLPYSIAFSGKKGFQFLIHLKPATYSLRDEIYVEAGTPLTVKDYYRELAADLKKKLELRSLDLPASGDPRRIRRVWQTQHFSKGVKSKTFCVPMSPAMIDSMTVPNILEYASQPRHIDTTLWNHGRKAITFEEFVDEYSIDPAASTPDADPDGLLVRKYRRPDNAKREEWFAKHIPYPCVRDEMMNEDNPCHMARFASAVWWRLQADDAPIIKDGDGLKRISYSPQWVEQFYQQMQYTDVYNDELRKTQIGSIWNRRDPYQMPNCLSLYRAGLCIGEECERYFMYVRKAK